MRPQGVVAILLALFLFFAVGGRIIDILYGVRPAPEETEIWIGLLQFIAGGLLTYIGIRNK